MSSHEPRSSWIHHGSLNLGGTRLAWRRPDIQSLANLGCLDSLYTRTGYRPYSQHWKIEWESTHTDQRTASPGGRSLHTKPTDQRTASPGGRSLHNKPPTTTWPLPTQTRTASPRGRSFHDKSPRTTWSLAIQPRTAPLGGVYLHNIKTSRIFHWRWSPPTQPRTVSPRGNPLDTPQ